MTEVKVLRPRGPRRKVSGAAALHVLGDGWSPMVQTWCRGPFDVDPLVGGSPKRQALALIERAQRKAGG